MGENGLIGTSLKHIKSYSEFTQHVTIGSAKVVALILVICLSGYHGMLQFLQVAFDSRKLSRKEYLAALWVYDAQLFIQHTAFLEKESNHWIFIGDSRVRQLFFQTLKYVDPKAEPSIILKDFKPNYYNYVQLEADSLNDEVEITDEDSRPLEKAHKSLTFNSTDLSLRISFFWRPTLNSSAVDLLNQLKYTRSLPKLVVVGSGAWQIKLSNGSKQGIEMYNKDLHQLIQQLHHWPYNSTQFLWKFQEPVDESKLSDNRRMITNNLIDQYNFAAEQVLRRSRFYAWRSARLSSENAVVDDDGLHISQTPLKLQAQMLFNLYCNPRIEVEDGTCCRDSEPVTILQIVTFTVLLVCSSISAFLWVYKQRRNQKPPSKQDEKADEVVEFLVLNKKSESGQSITPSNVENTAESKPNPSVKEESEWQVAVIGLGKLGVIMAFFFLCDRTTFFMKENKHYSHLNFWLPVVYVFTLGLFFNDESRSTRVLHRDQTDEWKGWMQLVILIYHITGASQVVALYMQMRILVSSYLFLTGYGHLCFFWNGGSASLVRLCQVLFRMNLMTVVICLCMNRPYQSYYFVPLVSFWYLIVYIVLAAPPKVSSAICDAKPAAYMYVILKFASLFAGITLLHLSQVFFESIFLLRPWKGLFVTKDDSIHEWWFRWSLDRYSICYGMVFGFVYLNAQKFGLIDDSTRQNLLNRARAIVPVVLAALIGFFGYTAFTLTCKNKPECNAVHSYVAFVPIVSFVLLRNVFGSVRVRYSSFFAWFGRISLELFIGQYHIWLAADTHGVLVLIPGYPVLNVLVTTFILICVAHEVHVVTGQLVSLAVPADWKRTLRNLIIFFLVLIPFGIQGGDL